MKIVRSINKRHLIIGLLGLGIIISSFVFIPFTKESKARNTVDNYLSAIKNGDETKVFLEDDVDGFIDVFDFEKLKSIEIPKEKDIITTTYDSWKEYRSDSYSSFEEFKKETKEIFADYEIIEDTSDKFTYWDKKSYKDKHKFLYNVSIANELGEKLYKKVEITTEYSEFVWDGENFNKGYIITEIEIR
jgi:hypothetical protein